ncbi:unnamed protein product [Didymodactylos carnosus]|uniref:TTF-type domain-containing protein n=1 Tax=Didymodactylos carnosus TaxID=1234261 RepID=A0A816A0L4_9BILA|nr:unnamed protein product [Didymodactylos carnosus]CAF4461061.1 unnamed protein product [Didymodactylos carnosus]
MSDKSKLHYYFVAKSTSSNETCTTHSITTMDKDVVDTNEITVLNEIDGNALTTSSLSIFPCFESQSQDSGNSDIENRLTTTTTTEINREPFSDCSQLNPFKRDPGRGPGAAREFLLLGPYQPITMFPTINHRHFCPNWYKVYSWLEFSEMTKKAYCFVCRLAYSHGYCEDAFTKNGFQNWSMTIKKFDKHQASSAHKHAYDSYVNAVKNHKENMDVVKLMDIKHKKKNIGKSKLSQRDNSNNCNLLELLEFRSVENELIKKKLNSLKYTHHSIQNEILSIIQQHILSQIVLEIKTSTYYSIMIDETSDISRHEQVSLVILDVSEAVVDVRNCFGVVKSLYNFIEASPKRHQVFEDLQKTRI